MNLPGARPLAELLPKPFCQLSRRAGHEVPQVFAAERPTASYRSRCTRDVPMASDFDPPQRWAKLIVAVVLSQRDPSGMDDWAKLCHSPIHILRQTCKVVGVSARQSLEFA